MKATQTRQFKNWIESLRDRKAQTVIRIRIARVEAGLIGDVKSVGDGVSELRIAFGPGYRVYFTRRGGELIILLNGGDKGSQSRDVDAAKKLAAQIY